MIVGREQSGATSPSEAELDRFKMCLEAAGYQVAIFRNGVEALRRAHEDPPDLAIIAEKIWPDEYGDRFVLELNQAVADLPIILLEPEGSRADFLAWVNVSSNWELYDLFDQGYLGGMVLSRPIAADELLKFVGRLTSP